MASAIGVRIFIILKLLINMFGGMPWDGPAPRGGRLGAGWGAGWSDLFFKKILFTCFKKLCHT
eukprot:SAG31_NODE_15692_length_742_cov_3.377916_1_plen_63_part_00